MMNKKTVTYKTNQQPVNCLEKSSSIDCLVLFCTLQKLHIAMVFNEYGYGLYS